MMDELDRSAILALLVRRDEALIERDEQTKIIKDANERLDKANGSIHSYADALKAFDIDLSDKEQFARIKKEFGGQIHRVLVERGIIKPSETKQQPLPLPEPEKKEVPTINEMILDRLKVAGATGSKAAPIREWIKKTHNIEIHEKTVGMSLYRLLKKDRVRRDGHTWFIVEEAVNPGAATPGPSTEQS